MDNEMIREIDNLVANYINSKIPNLVIKTDSEDGWDWDYQYLPGEKWTSDDYYDSPLAAFTNFTNTVLAKLKKEEND